MFYAFFYDNAQGCVVHNTGILSLLFYIAELYFVPGLFALVDKQAHLLSLLPPTPRVLASTIPDTQAANHNSDFAQNPILP